MLACSDPGEAYRRSEVDARITGTPGAQLVPLCCEQVALGIGTALAASRNDDRTARSKGLTQALSALTALEMGLDREHAISSAIAQLYGLARKAILDSVLDFDVSRLELVRTDFLEMAETFSKVTLLPGKA